MEGTPLNTADAGNIHPEEDAFPFSSGMGCGISYGLNRLAEAFCLSAVRSEPL